MERERREMLDDCVWQSSDSDTYISLSEESFINFSLYNLTFRYNVKTRFKIQKSLANNSILSKC